MKEDTWEQEYMQMVHLTQQTGHISTGDAHLGLS